MGVASAQPQPVVVELSPWWQVCGDPGLSALIEQALAGSPSVQLAQTRLQRAQAQEMQSAGADRPQAQRAGQVARQRFPERGLCPPPVAGATLSSGTAQSEAHGELDLFGRHRAELEASMGQRRVAQRALGQREEMLVPMIDLQARALEAHFALVRAVGGDSSSPSPLSVAPAPDASTAAPPPLPQFPAGLPMPSPTPLQPGDRT